MVKKTSEKTSVYVYDTLDLDFFSGNLNDVVKKVDDLKNKYSSYQTVILSASEGYSCYECSGYDSYQLTAIRLETDEEYNNRIDKETKLRKEKNKQSYENKKKRIAEEKETLRKLIKKYGNDV